MQILNYRFCAISSRNLSVYAFSCAFSFACFQWVSWNCRSTIAMETFRLYTHQHMDVHMAQTRSSWKDTCFQFLSVAFHRFTIIRYSLFRCFKLSAKYLSFSWFNNIYQTNHLNAFYTLSILSTWGSMWLQDITCNLYYMKYTVLYLSN